MTKVHEEYTGVGFDPDTLIEKNREERDKRLCPDVNDKYERRTL